MSNMQFSKAEAQELLSKVELINWLRYHNTDVGQRFKDEKDSKDQYKKLLNSLQMESNPEQIASLLINPVGTHPVLLSDSASSSSSLHSSSQAPFDEVIAGKIAKSKLQRSLKRKPINSMLSPATVLTENRRRDILMMMHQGMNVEPDDPPSPIHEESVCGSSTSPYRDSKASRLIDQRKQEARKKLIAEQAAERAFRPKWEHYDTMRTRWTYIQPQTKHLIPLDSVYAPNTSVGRFSVKGTVISGNVVEINNFLNQSQTMPSLQETLERNRSGHY